MTHKTRNEIAKWSDAELFAYAVTHGFGIKSVTGANPTPSLAYSFCYGTGYSDTTFWNVPYSADEAGLPMFEEKERETVSMILAGEHLTTWKAVKASGQDVGQARQAHQEFLASQS